MTKTILMTGCSSGIGYDAAHGMAARGWRVFATCRQEQDCARLRDQGLESYVLDYADEDSIREAVSETLRRTGGTLDAVYNNGAYAIPGAVEDLPRDALRAIYESNLFGYHDLTRLIIPVMRQQGHGRIVNCSSVLGFTPMKWRGAYVSTKFALEGLTQTLRLEMHDTPIHISLIQPGPITSDIRQNSIAHFEKWIDWRGSVRSDQYEGMLLKRLYESRGPDRFELPASAVTIKLAHALEAKRPRLNYYVTCPTYLMATLRRLLPARVFERIVAQG